MTCRRFRRHFIILYLWVGARENMIFRSNFSFLIRHEIMIVCCFDYYVIITYTQTCTTSNSTVSRK